MRNVSVAMLIVAMGGWCWGAGEAGTAPATPAAAEQAPVATEPEAPEVEKTVKTLSDEELKTLMDEYRRTSDVETRAELALMLNGQVKDRCTELLERIEKGKPEERLGAIELVGFVRKAEVTPVLAELAKSTDAEVARRAVDALGNNGDPKSLVTLQAILEGKDNVLAGRAAIAMGSIGDVSVLPVMVKGLKETKDLVVQLSLLRGLGLLKDKGALPVLQELSASDNPLVQAAVYDTVNLILGDDLARITAQLEDIAKALTQHGGGWETQMAQGAVTDSLDRVIKEAEKQSSSSSKSKQKRQTSKQGQQGKPTGGAAQASKGRTPASSENSPQRTSDNPTGVPGVNPATGMAWGNLPPSVREDVTAALKSDLPERYRRFLEIYYKILAEGK